MIGITTTFILAVHKTTFNYVLGPRSRRGFPGEGPDYSFLKEIEGLAPIPARIRGVMDLLF